MPPLRGRRLLINTASAFGSNGFAIGADSNPANVDDIDGGVMLVINESELGEHSGSHIVEFDAEAVIRVAVEGFKILIEQDRKH